MGTERRSPLWFLSPKMRSGDEDKLPTITRLASEYVSNQTNMPYDYFMEDVVAQDVQNEGIKAVKKGNQGNNSSALWGIVRK